MSEINNFLFKNWTVVVWFVAAVFAAGGIYSEFASLKNEVVVLEERLGKKIEIINSLEGRVIQLEKDLEYEKGYLQGKKEGN